MHSPSKRRALRAEYQREADHCRPFFDPKYFGYCNDCGREGPLRASAGNLVCATAICEDCLTLRNYYPSKRNIQYFGCKDKSEAFDLWLAFKRARLDIRV